MLLASYRTSRSAHYCTSNMRESSSHGRNFFPARGRRLVDFLVTSRLDAPQDLRHSWRAAKQHRTSVNSSQDAAVRVVCHVECTHQMNSAARRCSLGAQYFAAPFASKTVNSVNS